MLSHQRKYFIKTNTAIGITDEDVRHIINILNRNDMWNDKLNVMIADSMKKHDTTRTNVYRAIKTAFTNYAAAKNAKPLDEAAEISIIKKMRDGLMQKPIKQQGVWTYRQSRLMRLRY